MMNAHLQGPTVDGDDDIDGDDTCEAGEEEVAESDQEALQLVLQKYGATWGLFIQDS